MERTSATAVATPAAADSSRPLGDRLGDQVAGGLDLQAYAGQRGADAVVQVAPQPASLLLAGGHERRPALLEPVGEPQRGHGRGHLVADDGQQLGVAGGQARLPGRAVTQSVPTTSPRCRIGRLVAGPAGVPAAASGYAVRAIAENEARPSRAAATRRRPRRPGAGTSARSRPSRSPVAVGLEDPRGIGAIAVEHPVDAAVEPDAERVEQQPAHGGGRGRADGGAARAAPRRRAGRG